MNKTPEKSVHSRKVRENLSQFSEEVVEKIISISKVKIPSYLVDLELEETMANIRSQLQKQGITLEALLEKEKKEEKDFKEEQRPQAEKRARGKALLTKIIEIEKIVVTDKDIEMEKKIVMGPFYGKDGKLTAKGKEMSKTLASPQGRQYIEGNIKRDKVMTFLLKKFVPSDYGKFDEPSSIVTPNDSSVSGSIILPGQGIDSQLRIFV